MKKVIIITGQTATGKTQLALQKAIKENGELINADSRQIYKKLDIITGKDLTDHNFHLEKTKDDFDIGYYELRSTNNEPVKIWLCDAVDPKQYFSSFDFQTCALIVIKDILSRDKTPIIIGGTYFYLYHLLYDVETQNIPPNWKLRKQLSNQTIERLQKKLRSINPKLFNSLNESDRSNPQRLIRKIELSMAWSKTSEVKEPSDSEGGKTSEVKRMCLREKLKLADDIVIEYIGLRFKNKVALHTAIEKRVEERIKNGAAEEVKQLLKEGYTANDPGMKTIGYQQIIQYLKGLITYDQMTQLWRIREHQYAKRQYTFMKKDKNIKWLLV